MSDITIFDYEGQSISVEFADGNKMVNATQMAKPFKGKLVADFLRLKARKTIFSFWRSDMGIPISLIAKCCESSKEVMLPRGYRVPGWMKSLPLNSPPGLAPALSCGSMTVFRNCSPPGKHDCRVSRLLALRRLCGYWQSNGKNKNRSMKKSAMSWIKLLSGSIS